METNRIFVALNAKITDHDRCKVAMDAVVADAYAEVGTKTHWWCLGDDGESLFELE